METHKNIENEFYSYAESKLAFEMSIYSRRFPEKVIRQHPIGSYFSDFYFPHLKLVLEVDGLHHSDFKQEQHDKKRDKFMNKLGYTVVRISGKLAYQNPMGVISILKYFPKGRTFKLNSESEIALVQKLSAEII